MKKTLILIILCMMASISTCFAFDANYTIKTNILTIRDKDNTPVHAIMIPSNFPYHITKYNNSNGICIARW